MQKRVSAQNSNRREHANELSNFDQYDEIKGTGKTLSRHPATAIGGRRPRPENRTNTDEYAPNLIQEQDVSQSMNLD